MPYREFPVAPTELDPPIFKIGGKAFTALAEPPGGALADYFWLFTERIEVKAAGLVRFIEACLPEETVEDFQAVIHDKATIVPLQTLSGIAQWLVEVYADRPTTPSSGSPDGSAPTSDTPEGGADSPESTSEASASSA